jgi:hypothetical protein
MGKRDQSDSFIGSLLDHLSFLFTIFRDIKRIDKKTFGDTRTKEQKHDLLLVFSPITRNCNISMLSFLIEVIQCFFTTGLFLENSMNVRDSD